MGNPNHDELGRFSEGDVGSTGDKTTDTVLQSAGHDPAKFSMAMKNLGSMPKAEVFSAANSYLNEPGSTHQFKFDSKEQALRKVQSKFLQRLDSISKDSRV